MVKINDFFDIVYVIALPHRISYITSNLSKMGIRYMLFPAVTPDQIDQNKLILEGKISYKNSFKNINEICCSMSHLKVVTTFLNDSRYKNACIFEDDIVPIDYEEMFTKNIKDLPNDWECFNMGRCWANCFSEKKIGNGNVSIIDDSFCSHSYGLTKNGALKIMNNAFPMKKPIDIYYSELQVCCNLKFYNSSPRIFNQLKFTENVTSSIGNNDNGQECTNYIFSYSLKHYKIILTIITVFVIIFVLKQKK